MNPNRYFSPEQKTRQIAIELHQIIEDYPIISPHGHVNPNLFSDSNANFGSPADLFIIPDHYVTRMLYSQGIPLSQILMGDHREIWRIFCENFFLFRGTPSGIWLKNELENVFHIEETPSSFTANRIYDTLTEKLSLPEFSPRRLFDKFNIDVLFTTDSATDTLDQHKIIRNSGWSGNIRPTFRPDNIINIDSPTWLSDINKLSEVSGINVTDYKSYIEAIQNRRMFFLSMGAKASDHAVINPTTSELSDIQANKIFQRALKEKVLPEDSPLFTAHMLMIMAGMSVEDGLVMQIHPGSLRNHNEIIFNRFGPDKGADIPIQTEFTRNLLPLLNKYGNHSDFSLILFTLDESTYSRELATLAGHYPAVKLGPPWWFHDSLNGMNRYFDQVMETAGIYNTSGFNDDTRAFCSIPARHDVWRRASANWLANLVVRHIIEMEDAIDMVKELTSGLVKRAYRI